MERMGFDELLIEFLLIMVHCTPHNGLWLILKSIISYVLGKEECSCSMRVIHTIFVLLLLILTFPLCLAICIVIVCVSGFPILFQQKRIGYKGKVFTMYKFRTMKINSEKLQFKYKAKNEANGPVFKIYNDPRFTSVGKFLSHTGLDELPQLWNVLLGDMALFGPRPLPVSESRKLKHWQKKRYEAKPGIISPWVLEGYHRQTFDEWMRNDCQYVQQKNAWYDTKIFIASCVFMVKLFAYEVIKK